tara:strand:+ start:390 stop:839 length:450 start_codon:yes stop_codon:yes gene_type:complete
MKISRRQLRKLINEASQEFKIKTVSPEQYAADVATLPQSMQSIASGPRSTERPSNRYIVGNFFMTKGVPFSPPKGYGGLKKLYNFYMILPDGEAISIDNPRFQPSNSNDVMTYLNLLDKNVTPIEIDSLENARVMIDQINNVINIMREK